MLVKQLMIERFNKHCASRLAMYLAVVSQASLTSVHHWMWYHIYQIQQQVQASTGQRWQHVIRQVILISWLIDVYTYVQHLAWPQLQIGHSLIYIFSCLINLQVNISSTTKFLPLARSRPFHRHGLVKKILLLLSACKDFVVSTSERWRLSEVVFPFCVPSLVVLLQRSGGRRGLSGCWRMLFPT